MSSIPTAEVQSQQSHLYQNQTHQLSAFFIVCAAVSLICMIARTVSRKVTGLGFKADDYVFLAGAATAEGSFIVLMLYSFKAGLGEHWLALSSAQLRLFPKLNYAYNILNIACYPLIKTSILLLYDRLFIVSRFQQVVRLCLVIVAMIGVSTTLAAIFACSPVRGFYDSSVKARCIDDVKFYWASACLNVITDAFILILPMPMEGYSFIGDAYSTAAEVCLAIICASAPTWRPLFRRTLEISRAPLGSLKRKTQYCDIEKKVSPGGDDSLDRQNSDQHLIESGLPTFPTSAHAKDRDHTRGRQYSLYDDAPNTQVSTYGSQARESEEIERCDYAQLPIGRINVKHEVKVEASINPHVDRIQSGRTYG
ncbi:hypothetical protein MMC14_008094 [Varicellaria rhodocarpa]|nr:hypothetical protein [Varicellaria rhodocarpa]